MVSPALNQQCLPIGRKTEKTESNFQHDPWPRRPAPLPETHAQTDEDGKEDAEPRGLEGGQQREQAMEHIPSFCQREATCQLKMGCQRVSSSVAEFARIPVGNPGILTNFRYEERALPPPEAPPARV